MSDRITRSEFLERLRDAGIEDIQTQQAAIQDYINEVGPFQTELDIQDTTAVPDVTGTQQQAPKQPDRLENPPKTLSETFLPTLHSPKPMSGPQKVVGTLSDILTAPFAAGETAIKEDWRRAGGGKPKSEAELYDEVAKREQLTADPGLLVGGSLYGPAKAIAKAAKVSQKAAPYAAAGLESLTGALATQASRWGQGKRVSPGEAALETTAGALTPAIKPLAKGAKGVVENIAEGLSQTPKEAMKKYGVGGLVDDFAELLGFKTKLGKGAKEVREASGRADEIGQELVDMLYSAHRYMPEEEIIQPALTSIDVAPVDRIYRALREAGSSKRATAKSKKQIENLIKELQDTFGTGMEEVKLIKPLGGQYSTGQIETTIRPSGVKEGMWEVENTYPARNSLGRERHSFPNLYETKEEAIDWARKMFGGELQHGKGILDGHELRDLRIRLDKEVGDKFGEAAGDFIEAVKKGRTEAQNVLIEQANDPAVKEAFKSEAKKFKTIDRLRQVISPKQKTAEVTVENKIRNMFGKNKTEMRRRMKEFEDIFGGNFTDRIQMTVLSERMGPGGVPPWLPQQWTGRSLLGIGLGSQAPGVSQALGVDIPLERIAPILLSSPKVSTGVLGAQDLLEEAAGKIPAKARDVSLMALRRFLEKGIGPGASGE